MDFYGKKLHFFVTSELLSISINFFCHKPNRLDVPAPGQKKQKPGRG